MNIKRVELFMFDPLFEQVPQPVVIDITQPMPEDADRMTLDEFREWYDDQAMALVEALYRAIPQGVFERVLYHMMCVRVEGDQALFKGKTEP